MYFQSAFKLALVLASTLALGQLPSGSQEVAKDGGSRAARRSGSTGILKATGGGDLIACNANGSALTQGGIVRLDPTTFAGTLIGDPVDPGGIAGLACLPSGRLFGSVPTGGSGSFADLVEIDPVTATLISTVPLIESGFGIRIGDLAAHPVTGVLYGIGTRFGYSPGSLFTIDTATGAATHVGSTGLNYDGGLAFDAAGTLYLIANPTAFPNLHTLDPATGAVLTTIAYGPDIGRLHGLTVRPSDGTLIACRAPISGSAQIIGIDPTTGLVTPLGDTGTGTPADLTYLQSSCPPSASSFSVRLGTPPNPNAYLPGTTGPILGAVWDPRIDHTSFATGAGFDFMAVSGMTSNIPTPIGTILCGTTPFLVLTNLRSWDSLRRADSRRLFPRWTRVVRAGWLLLSRSRDPAHQRARHRHRNFLTPSAGGS